MLENVAGSSLTFANGLVQGTGTIGQAVSATGASISPGLSPGTLTVSGDATLGPDSFVVVEMAGDQPGEFDELVVTGTANLGGTVLIGYLDGYEPVAGDTFTLVTAGAINGTFDAVTGTGEYDVAYTATDVTITVVDPDQRCPVDINNSADTDALDLLAILAAWGPCPGCPEDSNNDGVVDALDFLSLIAFWGPCPEIVLYDVTFDSPLHTVGQPPTLGGGPGPRATPTNAYGYLYNFFARPKVQSSFGPLTDQPLVYDGNYWQYLWLDAAEFPAGSRVRIELDLVVDSGFNLTLYPASRFDSGGTGTSPLYLSHPPETCCGPRATPTAPIRGVLPPGHRATGCVRDRLRDAVADGVPQRRRNRIVRLGRIRRRLSVLAFLRARQPRPGSHRQRANHRV